ncbi:MAG: cytochrome c oxidase accessory protein CcoG [Ignavibacteria bacterium]|nr:cytochrome c oxidase accessory protein CcoG [Ignavibacteria bacterium]
METLEREDPVAKEVSHDTFRNTISIVEKDGHRKWIYPKKPKGRFYNARTFVSWILLIILFGVPFIKVDGNPFFLFNIVDRKFIIFGQIFTTQDFYLFGLLMISVFVSLFLVTAVFGRVFCGWVCPQPVFLEMVFRKIEYLIEGDYMRQMELNKSPWNAKKIFRKGLKYLIFFSLSFLIANIFLSYIIGIDELWKIINEPVSQHLTGFIAITIFTLFFYWIFAWFREQACILVCPYGRMQGVLLDKNTTVIAYDYKRGEPRGKLTEKDAKGLGDCIDCNQCVVVCPTGIDIRNGTQLECINCAVCIDACDSIMDKINLPRGLIRYDSMEGIRTGKGFKWTPRVIGYMSVLLILLSVTAYLFASRKDVDVNILRTPGLIYQNQGDDKVSNMYNFKMSNKTFSEIPLTFALSGAEGEIRLAGSEFSLKPMEIHEGTLLIVIPKANIKKLNTPVSIVVSGNGKVIDEVKTTFIGPPN